MTVEISHRTSSEGACGFSDLHLSDPRHTLGMTDYRRNQVSGGMYCFTVNPLERKGRWLVEHVECLRAAVRAVRRERPFRIDAREGVAGSSSRGVDLAWRRCGLLGVVTGIKKVCSQGLPKAARRSAVRAAQGERGIWQRRFGTHTIRDEADYAVHLDPVQFNHVKHGWVRQAAQWPYSTFHRAVAMGVYPRDRANDGAPDLSVAER